MIELYTDATPNGLKVSIVLEELGLDYQAHRLNLGGDQMEPVFTQMNPNQKIPVIKDGETIVTESGAILFYLAEKTGQLIPSSLAERSKVMERLMLQMSGLGPHFGQLLVWAGAWENEFPKVTTRYQMEVKRLFKLLDHYLSASDYLAGSHYSIADIAFIPWIRLCHIHPIGEMLNLAEHPHLNRWYDLVSQRPAVQRGLLVPEPHEPEVQFKAFVSAVVGLGELHQV